MRSILDIRPVCTGNLEDAVGLVESFIVEHRGREAVRMDHLSAAFTLSIDRKNYHGFIGYIEGYPMCLIAVEERFSVLAERPFGQITELYVEPQFRWEGATALLIERVEEVSKASGWSHINGFSPDQKTPPIPRKIANGEKMTDLKSLIVPMTPATHALLTLNYFAQRTGRTDMASLHEELMSLCEGENACLEPWAIYIDAHGDEHTIDGEDFDEYLETGTLVCPVAGVIINNPDEHLSVYWARREDPAPTPS